MVTTEKRPVGQQRQATATNAGGSIVLRVLMGIVLLLIAVAAVTGVVMALSSGQPQVAFIIGLVAAAFFARVGC